MPSGKVFHDVLAAGIDTDTGAVPSSKVRTATVELCNKGAGNAVIKAYISTSATPAVNKLVEPGYLITPNGGYIRTFIVDQNERIILNADTDDVVARITCFEEDR